MNRLRLTAFLFSVLVAAPGCGAAEKAAMAPAMGGAGAAPPPPPPSVMAAPAPGGPLALAMNDPAKAKTVSDTPHSVAMLIYTANLSLAVFQVEPQLDAVERVAREAGGYLSSRQDNVHHHPRAARPLPGRHRPHREAGGRHPPRHQGAGRDRRVRRHRRPA